MNEVEIEGGATAGGRWKSDHAVAAIRRDVWDTRFPSKLSTQSSGTTVDDESGTGKSRRSPSSIVLVEW